MVGAAEARRRVGFLFFLSYGDRRRRRPKLVAGDHEHVDHNAVEQVPGEPQTLRARTAGTTKTPSERGRGSASEHGRREGRGEPNGGPNQGLSSSMLDGAGARSQHFGE